MARRIEAYVDTSALIAFVDVSDTHHPLFRRLFADPPALLTSSLVVAEGHAWFLRRYDAGRALAFLSMIEVMPFLSVADVGPQEIKPAQTLLRRFAGQPLTLADAVGLYLAKTHRVRTAWSTDRHLGLTGLPLAIHRH